MANITSDVTLFDAAKKGNLDDLRAIKNQGQKYIVCVDPRGYNIAHLAAEAGTSGVIQWIQQNKLDLLNNFSNTGYTPLHVACEFGFLDCLIALKMGNANLNAETIPDKLTGAHICARQGHLQCIQFLHSNGANLNGKDKFQNTPITAAAHNGQKEVVQFLSETLKIPEQNIPNLINAQDPMNRHMTTAEREMLFKKAIEEERKKMEKNKGGSFLDTVRNAN